jgi:hypothetical protein
LSTSQDWPSRVNRPEVTTHSIRGPDAAVTA